MPIQASCRVLRSLTRLLAVLVLVAGSAAVSTGSAAADVITPFTQVYDKVVYGDFNIIGNTVTKCPAASSPLTSVPCANGANRTDTDAVNDMYAMAWADIDANPATFNSSSAGLTVPPGATIDHVRLYWAGDTGRYTDSDGTPEYPVCSGNALALGEYATTPAGTPQTQSVSVRLGAGATVSVAPQTFVSEPPADPTEAQYYSATADITSLFSAAPTGSPLTVTVGNVWTPQGYNCFGGWSLTLVYKYAQPDPTYAPVPREIFVYDGHVRQDSLQAPTTVLINGFRYPGGALHAGVTAYEGDWGISGDQFLVNGTPVAEPSGTGSGNFFVDSAEGQVNPNNLNNFSVDAKDFVLPPGTLPVGANSLTLQLNTTGDSYLAQQVAFSVPLPTLNVVKEVCTSSTPANCGSGGAGPWAENTLIPVGSTAYWRIKVSNPTTLDIPGVTLNDPATPACETAAGTFTVLAGQTLTFYCSSPNLTTALVNSVTARFVPQSAPAGSPPVDTSPDTARADVHGLTVAKQVCSSLVAANCGAGGAGPWVELATIPAGTTARWKITVTNIGSVDLTGVTLNDAAQPGCVTAAGTFTVAAGASTSFYCSTASVAAGNTNTVTAQYMPPGGSSPVMTTPDDARVRVSGLAVAKEVCGSAVAGDCGAGGTGPWLENRTVPTGSTVYWRITVTNTGEADLTAITLNDAGEASCVTAAGSFDLAVSASKAFYCSTANLTANKTNTVTAQYVPPGAPPGTTPVLTTPDGATVTVYGLALVKEVCSSLSDADCAAGGPWVETANLPSGSTAHWRITATNTGDVDLTGITLNDPSEASCAVAPFNLAAGASVSFPCSTSNVTAGRTNTVTATFTPPGGTPVTTPPDSATVRVTNLALVKEVCASATCAPGSWADTVTLPTGSTAYWRITVTNTGEVDLTGITLNDPSEASCVPGPFDLAVGASKAFSCSTAGITKNTTNTATTQYVPPGTPPGTEPVVSTPDTATATVFGLVLAKEVCSSLTAADCASGGPWVETANLPSGSTAHWRITVTNTGDVDLTGITLNDAAEASCAVASFDLAAGESVSFPCSTSNVTNSVTNTVTATFTPPGGTLLTTAPDSAAVNVTNLALVKEVCASATCAPGSWSDTVTLPTGSTAYWRLTVTNTGDVDLTGITLNDPSEASCVPGPFDLAVDESKAFYCSTTGITKNTTNTATAQYIPPGTPPGTEPVVTSPDDATANVYGLALAKEVCSSLDAADCASSGPWVETANLPSGSTAHWRITVTNTGDVDLTGIVLNDAAEPGCSTTAGTFDLAVGATKTFYCSTAAVTDSVTNTVTATFTPPGGSLLTTAPDSAAVNVTSLAVVKEVCSSLDATDCASSGPWVETANLPSGSTAYWRVTVTNTGEVGLTGITLNDPSEASCVTGPFDLAVDESKAFYCSTAAVTTGRTNTVTAAYPPPGSPSGTSVTTPPASATVKVTDLALVKEVCASATCAPGSWGDTVTLPTGSTAYWRLTVTNTGEVDLTAIALNDPSEASCVPSAFDLAVDETKAFYCSTAGITKNTTNTATAQYVPPGTPPGTEPIVSTPDTATATVFGLVLAKEVCSSLSDADCAAGGPWVETANLPSGSTAHWRITATNTGDVDLTGITLNDPSEASCAVAPFNLAAGASVSFPCSTSNVTAGRTNTVTATFTPPGGTPVTTPPDSATVKVTDLALVKEVCASATCAPGSWSDAVTLPTGSTAYWRLTVTNTGEVDLTGITINDPSETSCVPSAFDLAIDESKAFFCSTAGITKNTTNTATAQYTPPSTPPGTEPIVSTPDTATATVFGLVLAKEVCSSLTAADCASSGPWVETANLPSGSTAHWRITATNTGDVDLTGITLNDAAEASCAVASFDLAAGASVSFPCSTSNVTAGQTNTVTATFTPPGGTEVTTPPDSATVKVTNLALVKEVCASATCDPGPWSDTVNLPTGSTAYWRITVTNTGEVDLTGITLNDPSETSCVPSPFDLAVDETKAFYCSTTGITKNTTNTATAQYIPPGTPPGTEPVVTSPDEATANVYDLQLVKEICSSLDEADCGPNGPGPWGLDANIPSGGTAYWRITVTNTGDIGLTGITLTDADEPSCDTSAFDLAVGESRSFYCSTTDVTDSVTNSVTASFDMMGWPEEITVDAIAAVVVADLQVQKEICSSLTTCDAGPWVDSATLPKGSTAHWRITVTNTGDVDLTGIVLTDPAEASCVPDSFDLASGAAKEFLCSTANVTTSTTNAVTAEYVPPGSPPDTPPVVTPPADATANVSDLLVRKDICQSAAAENCTATGAGPWGDSHVVERGGTARWRITVTNAGEVDLAGITLNDATEPSCSPGGFDLAAGESASFTCATTNLTASVTNTASGRYTPPGAPVGTPPVESPPDDATVRVADLTVQKDACLTNDATCPWGETVTVHSGGTAYWRITVVNTGEVDLSGVTVQDPAEPGCAAGTFDLPTGANKTVYCSTAGLVAAMVNTATASYPLPGSPPIVTRPDSARADVSPVPAPPPSPPLATTGNSIWPLVAAGLLLIGLGVLLRVYGRRRT